MRGNEGGGERLGERFEVGESGTARREKVVPTCVGSRRVRQSSGAPEAKAKTRRTGDGGRAEEGCSVVHVRLEDRSLLPRLPFLRIIFVRCLSWPAESERRTRTRALARDKRAQLTLAANASALAFSAASFSAIFIFVMPFARTGGAGPEGAAFFFALSSSESEASQSSYSVTEQCQRDRRAERLYPTLVSESEASSSANLLLTAILGATFGAAAGAASSPDDASVMYNGLSPSSAQPHSSVTYPSLTLLRSLRRSRSST